MHPTTNHQSCATKSRPAPAWVCRAIEPEPVAVAAVLDVTGIDLSASLLAEVDCWHGPVLHVMAVDGRRLALSPIRRNRDPDIGHLAVGDVVELVAS